ncbi:ParA family protein, partial [Desulfovibrio sp. OttesenSCG-928-C06]|nr:ParA family protein [Desulfovibrio sp. OttesenSCG-928-C06]
NKTPLVIAVTNQKGGVGKTTTTHNLGAALADFHKKKVLMVDMDPQGNLSDSCGSGLQDDQTRPTVYELIKEDSTVSFDETRVPLRKNLDLLPSNIRLAVADMSFAHVFGRESLLKNALADLDYDVVLIDCPPSLGILTVNSLTAADFLLVPVQAEYHSMAGLRLMLDSVRKIRRQINPDLEVLGLLLTMYEEKKRLNKDVADFLAETGESLFKTSIRRNIRLAEAPSHGLDIFQHDPKCPGALDYMELAKETLKEIKARKAARQSAEGQI